MKRVEAKDDIGRRYVSYDLAAEEIVEIIKTHLLGHEDFAVASGNEKWITMDDRVFGLRFIITLD